MNPEKENKSPVDTVHWISSPGHKAGLTIIENRPRGGNKICNTYVHIKPQEYLIFMSSTKIPEVLLGYVGKNT